MQSHNDRMSESDDISDLFCEITESTDNTQCSGQSVEESTNNRQQREPFQQLTFECGLIAPSFPQFFYNDVCVDDSKQ